MLPLIDQAQRALGALSPLLLLAPAQAQGRIAEVVGAIGTALYFAATLPDGRPGIVARFAALRENIEAIAASKDALTAQDIAIALAHLESASADFRSAIANRQSFT